MLSLNKFFPDNLGTDDLGVSSISSSIINQVGNAAFTINASVSSENPIVLNSIQTATIQFTIFNPTDPVLLNNTNFSGNIIVVSNDPNNSTALLPFSIVYRAESGPDADDPTGDDGDGNGNDGQDDDTQTDTDVGIQTQLNRTSGNQYFAGLSVYGNSFVPTTNKRRIKNS